MVLEDTSPDVLDEEPFETLETLGLLEVISLVGDAVELVELDTAELPEVTVIFVALDELLGLLDVTLMEALVTDELPANAVISAELLDKLVAPDPTEPDKLVTAELVVVTEVWAGWSDTVILELLDTTPLVALDARLLVISAAATLEKLVFAATVVGVIVMSLVVLEETPLALLKKRSLEALDVNRPVVLDSMARSEALESDEILLEADVLAELLRGWSLVVVDLVPLRALEEISLRVLVTE
ncbi:hypothetical protein LTR28_006372 [Elasticomyces elasticus]|nr:hypothetical protein LTR28_006372 [Elasticomyces elasticus]